MIDEKNKEIIKKAVRDILIAVGENPDRAGLIETPQRVANMYEELFSGLNEDPKQHLKMFDEKSNDEVVIVRDIPFSSMCEHHLLPFVGKAHIAYIPSDNKIIGLSKLARIVDNFAKKPQVQERLTHDIADFLNDNLSPKGVAVIIEAEHMCMSIRGAKASGSETQTSALRGSIRTDARTRAEVLSLLTK
ncbi:MAG: GTP cyclohydrolase I FolE [Eubacterium sp.]|nr:GTP cyclohydrolase I FolE [Eubacterium sp.]